MARRKKTEPVLPTEELPELDDGPIYDELDAEADMLNDPSIDHLPPPSEVGSYPTHASDVFEGASDWGGAQGRSVSPRLLAHAAAFPGCERLRVWRVDEGRPLGLGTIGRDASEEDLVGKFGPAMLDAAGAPTGGRFLLRPVDGEGRYLGQEFRLNIDRHHEAFAKIASPTNGSNGSSPTSDMMALFQQLLAQTNKEAAEGRQRDHERTESLLREREEMAAERVALASNAATGVQSVAERMMGADAQRQAEMMTTIQGMFSQTLAMTQEAAARERERAEMTLQRQREEARIAAEQQRLRSEQERERDRQYLEERRITMERERDDRRDELERRERERMHQMDQSLQREREHAERMVTLQSRGGLGAVEGLLKTFGSNPRDAFDWFRENMGGDKGEGMGVSIVKGVTEVAKSFGEAASQQAQASAQAQAMEEEEAAIMQQQLHAQQMAAQRQLQGPQPPRQRAPAPRAQAPAAAPAPAPQQALGATLPLPVQRKARKAIAALVARLRAEPESEWSGIITLGVMQQPTVIDYIRVATIKAAMIEGGADEAFAMKVVGVIDSSGLVPASIPRV